MAHFKIFIYVTGALLLISGICDKNPVDNEKTNPTPAFGAFIITLTPPQGIIEGNASILGRILDGSDPSTIIWEEAAASGECRLLTPRVPFCSDPCGGNAACVEDDSCQPYPSKIYAGKATITGVKTRTGNTTITVDTMYSSGLYQPVGIEYPPFLEGETVTVSTTGSNSVPALNLSGKGIRPLEVQDDSIVLEDNKDVALHWTPPANAGASTMSITVDISHHGGTRGKIVYEGPDKGSLIIPGSLITQLKALGYFGFPKIEFVRRAVTKDPATNVELVFESVYTSYNVFIPGLISCNGDEDCPEGMTCEYFRCH